MVLESLLTSCLTNETAEQFNDDQAQELNNVLIVRDLDTCKEIVQAHETGTCNLQPSVVLTVDKLDTPEKNATTRETRKGPLEWSQAPQISSDLQVSTLVTVATIRTNAAIIQAQFGTTHTEMILDSARLPYTKGRYLFCKNVNLSFICDISLRVSTVLIAAEPCSMSWLLMVIKRRTHSTTAGNSPMSPLACNC